MKIGLSSHFHFIIIAFGMMVGHLNFSSTFFKVEELISIFQPLFVVDLRRNRLIESIYFTFSQPDYCKMVSF